MRSFAYLFAVSVLLMGCDVGLGSEGASEQFFQEVQEATSLVCNFVPKVGVISEILGLRNPELTAASAIATAVCGAITTSAGAEALPNVQGVLIEGYFVN
jgi:hypothetical protein